MNDVDKLHSVRNPNIKKLRTFFTVNNFYKETDKAIILSTRSGTEKFL